jgi:hypothetical protein
VKDVVAEGDLSRTVVRSRRWKRIAPLLLALIVTLSLPVAAHEEPRRPCREHPEVKPPCFIVHGRLSWWNGSPAARIWIVGTKRMLGVSDGHSLGGFEQMPEDVLKKLAWGANVFGDYEFCPFTESKAGVMQLGCIQSGKNLRVEKRHP